MCWYVSVSLTLSRKIARRITQYMKCLGEVYSSVVCAASSNDGIVFVVVQDG